MNFCGTIARAFYKQFHLRTFTAAWRSRNFRLPGWLSRHVDSPCAQRQHVDLWHSRVAWLIWPSRVHNLWLLLGAVHWGINLWGRLIPCRRINCFDLIAHKYNDYFTVQILEAAIKIIVVLSSYFSQCIYRLPTGYRCTWTTDIWLWHLPALMTVTIYLRARQRVVRTDASIEGQLPQQRGHWPSAAAPAAAAAELPSTSTRANLTTRSDESVICNLFFGTQFSLFESTILQ